MPDFSATGYITLQGAQEVPASGPTALTWTGTSNDNRDFTVTDTGNDSILTEDQDGFSLGTPDFTYSGWYVTVGGQDFGVFEWNGFFVVPYNSAEFDLRNDPASPFHADKFDEAGSTSTFDSTLENGANCFLLGTLIATPDGARAIETLQPGDPVLTATGDVTRVAWLWTQHIRSVFGVDMGRRPVRISAHALGPDCPARDLCVSADHAIFVDGLLVNAGALVNGTTIVKLPVAEQERGFTFWHVETDGHCLLLAENCPSESFVDYVGRDAFDNYAAYCNHGGTNAPIREISYPRVTSARQLPAALKARLATTCAA